MKRILIATTNKGKLREFRDLLSGLNIEVLSLEDMENKIEVEEDKETFLENAIKKAKEYAKFYNMPVIAEDAGLEVQELNGYPGVYSARFYEIDFGGKEDITENKDKANIKKLLRLLQGKENRDARYVSVVVFYNPEDFGIWTEGFCYGKIAEKPIGEGGFGYDPIFIPQGYDKTMAQLSPEEKNKISHRGIAVRKLINILEKVIH
ncbi:RdgB/HAM1 family non-canonical purine NTP pyrophosphatase [Venenivibrio stagnispumantis]|uniref:dITP/XTP pyrophosphatase n=1 Tax=Venenivibrio stagnispumantis TaxID=407998 RepID=A0AA46ADQ3_9AQUI|nr:RdgB/HAM1 family non-canonical purine NTP pyrophosphatase [Venenivibrio stagnispumantis]MCW4573505.1 RdgB/HAM1 family non-canonical purine NTP pyrophosphatase [Venenivibrio stagnispumantis]SMP06412.1 XTP/dITP diphosphohydrolase [Venenivibrio stagnispumantis]